MNDTQSIYELLQSMSAVAPKYEFTKPGQKMEKTKQDLALDHVRDGGYIIGSIDTNGSISFNTNPVIHNSPQSARTECKRLAQLNPGRAFAFVKFTGAELVPTRSISI